MENIGQRDLLIDSGINKKYLEPIAKDSNKDFFATKTDIYLMAAVIGYKNKQKLKSKSTQSIRQARELSLDQDLIIYTIGFAENNSIDFLVPEPGYRKTLFKLIEEYANGGARMLYDMTMYQNDKIKPLDQKVYNLLKNHGR
jgi:dnd system-associated protein 4